jgi:hypothetical protein
LKDYSFEQEKRTGR